MSTIVHYNKTIKKVDRLQHARLSSGDRLFDMDNIYLIDVTTAFGVGKEPTQDWLDELIRIKGWFDGESVITDEEWDYMTRWQMEAQVVDAVNDLAGDGRTTETVKGNADAISNRARTLNNGALMTVTDNNQYYPLLSNVAGTLLAKHQINVWNGSAWSAVNNYGFGYSALQHNTGGSSNGVGQIGRASCRERV